MAKFAIERRSAAGDSGKRIHIEARPSSRFRLRAGGGCFETCPALRARQFGTALRMRRPSDATTFST